jgi:hypothetical protein
MNLEDTQHDPANTVVEELTAYLDGELDEATQIEVESRLGTDPEYLAELQSLQQTWETLDHLPKIDAGKNFTQTTMELVVQDVKATQIRKPISWASWLPALLIVCLGGGLFAAGYAYQRSSQRLPDKLLIENLPAIQKHEIFQSINLDLDLLEQLNHHSLFPHLNFDPVKSFESSNGQEREPETTKPIDTLEARKSWLENLDVEQKAGLSEKLDRFLALSPEKQQAIIEFQRLLAEHPQSDQLNFVLNEYYYWLKSLDPGERSRLQDLPPDEFLPAIQKLRVLAREENARRIFEQAASSLPNREDADYIFNWYQILINAKERVVRERFPLIYNRYRKRRNQQPLPESEIRRKFERRELSLIAKFLMMVDPDFETHIVKDSEMDLLIDGLSSETRELLFNMPEQMRRETIFAWLESINEIYSRTLRVSNEELFRFASGLPESERDELNRLPIREYMPRLMELFRRKNSSLPNNR